MVVASTMGLQCALLATRELMSNLPTKTNLFAYAMLVILETIVKKPVLSSCFAFFLIRRETFSYYRVL